MALIVVVVAGERMRISHVNHQCSGVCHSSQRTGSTFKTSALIVLRLAAAAEEAKVPAIIALDWRRRKIATTTPMADTRRTAV